MLCSQSGPGSFSLGLPSSLPSSWVYRHAQKRLPTVGVRSVGSACLAGGSPGSIPSIVGRRKRKVSVVRRLKPSAGGQLGRPPHWSHAPGSPWSKPKLLRFLRPVRSAEWRPTPCSAAGAPTPFLLQQHHSVEPWPGPRSGGCPPFPRG